VPQHEAGEREDPEERDLVAAEHHERRDRPGGGSVEHGSALQGARQEPEDDRHIGQAEDLPDVLDAPGRGGAEGKHDGGDEAPRRMPGAIPEEGEQRRPAETQHGKRDGVEGPESGIGIDEREEEIGRGEDERLRVGDLRRPGEHVWRPERRLAGVNGLGQELQLRIEVRLGVPRDGDRPGQPRPAEGEPARAEERERGCERPGLLVPQRRRISPARARGRWSRCR
jgi:hypothetical protein